MTRGPSTLAEAPARLDDRTATAVRAVGSLWSAQWVSLSVAAIEILGLIAFSISAVVPGLRPAGLAAVPFQLFLVRHPVQALIGVLAALLLVGAAERRIGHGRTLLIHLISCAASGLSAVAIHLVVEAVFLGHQAAGFEVAVVPAFVPSVGTIVAASAFAGTMWRRRIRVVSLASAAAFVLFAGSFSGLLTLVVALVGLAVGSLLRHGRTPRRIQWVRSSHHESRVLLSLVIAVSAGGLLASVLGRSPVGPFGALGVLFRDPLPTRRVSPACRGIGGEWDPGALSRCTLGLSQLGLHGPGALLVGIAPLVVLLVAAFYVQRGLRAAIVTAAAVNVVLSGAAFAQLLILPDKAPKGAGLALASQTLLLVAASVIPLAIAVLLVAKGRHVRVPSSRRAVTLGASAIVLAGGVLVAGYVVAGSLDENVFRQPTSTGALVGTGLMRLLPFGFSGVSHLGAVPLWGVARVLFTNMGWVFWTVVLVALIVMCRHPAHVSGPAQSSRLRSLLHRGGQGSLSHMATWAGNDVWMDPETSGAVAYRAVGGVAITLGAPICPGSRTGEVVAAFSTWCDDQGLTPVFYSVGADLRPVFQSMGWYSIPVGEETIIHPRTFSLQGKKSQDVRSSINRADKSMLSAVWTRFADLPSSSIRQIREISEQWVAEKSLPEMEFTLGGLPELSDPEVRLMLAVADDGRVDAVTSWLPTYRDGVVIGWTLDFMRRRPDSMNGVMEFVIASTITRAQDDDLEFVSLSVAPLVSHGETTTAIDGMMGFLSRSLEPAYGFRSLFAFKKKFQPEYRELTMAYPDPLLLPRIGTAVTRAYLPGLSPRHVAQLLRRSP